MVCDCEYAEKNNGMDKDTQACVAEKLTLDHSLSLVNEAETLATKDTAMITRDHQGLRRINSTTKTVVVFGLHIFKICVDFVFVAAGAKRWTHITTEKQRSKSKK